ncbi:MAG: type IX secretion system protein PorQ, partial [Bacteroidota bacterium]
LAFLLGSFITTLSAQIGGISAYEFLNLPNSATVAAMGGHHIALQDDDLSLAARNPALLNKLMDQKLAISHAFHPAGISNSYLAFAKYRKPLKMTFQASLQYTSYGNDLIRRDATGQEQGTFSANDYALTVGASRRFEGRFTIGANLKLINSQLADFNSFGLAGDLGVHYRDTSGRFGISILARNIGTQLSQYDASSGREPLPYELQIGINRELEHLPFRFSIIYRYLNRWNVLYDDPNARDQSIFIGFDNQESERSAGAIWFDNFFRHFVFNGELMVGKQRNLRLRFGYNHGLRRELSLVDYRSLAGYSLGFALRVKRFQIAYGRTTYHIGGGINQLGLDLDLRKRL